MKVEAVISELKRDKLLDDWEIYVYASQKRTILSAAGTAYGPVLLSVYHGVLHILRAKLDNSYAECLCVFAISDLQNIQGKAGLLGGSFSFEYGGQHYIFQLPSRSNKFVDYFIK